MSKPTKDEQKPSTAVTAPATPSTALAGAPSAEALALFGAHAGAGKENVRAEDRAIPFIGLVQSMSPQRKKGDPKYIAGAEEGSIFNSVSNALYDGTKGVLVVPVFFEKLYNRWIRREDGGGFAGSFRDPECLIPVGVPFAPKDFDGEYQVKPTANHYLLVLGEDGNECEPALLTMTSTKLKISRKWNAQMAMVRVAQDGKQVPAPSFAKVYRLTSVQEENDKGTFHNFIVADAGWVDPDTFGVALDFYKSLKAGKVKVAAPELDDDSPTIPEAEGEGKSDLPF